MNMADRIAAWKPVRATALRLYYVEPPRFRTLLIDRRLTRLPMPYVLMTESCTGGDRRVYFMNEPVVTTKTHLGAPPLPHVMRSHEYCMGSATNPGESPSRTFWQSHFSTFHPVGDHAWPMSLDASVKSLKKWGAMTLDEVLRVKWFDTGRSQPAVNEFLTADVVDYSCKQEAVPCPTSDSSSRP